MDADSLLRYITETFEGVDVGEAYGFTFFYYDPEKNVPAERKFSFATMATDDTEYDRISNLSRPGAYRLNLGVKKETYRSLFGPPPMVGDDGVINTDHDFTALDQLLPHPNYAPQSWICVVSPSDETFEKTVRSLIEEAYDEAVRKHGKASRDA